MSPEQFAIMQCLTNIEKEEAELEQTRENQLAMLRGFILAGSPRIVPAVLAPGWMQVVDE